MIAWILRVSALKTPSDGVVVMSGKCGHHAAEFTITHNQDKIKNKRVKTGP